jgi:acetyl-CoA synthetase
MLAEAAFASSHVCGFATSHSSINLQITENCLDRHVAAGFGTRPAITFEADDGSSRVYTFQQLLDNVCATARVLEANGVKKGDRVSLCMPMIPQLLFSVLACARIGAVHSTIFAGFSAEAVAERIVNCKSDLVITAVAGLRGGKVVPLKNIVDKALEIAEKRGNPVRRVLVTHRPGERVNENIPGWVDGRDVSLDKQLEEAWRHTIGTGTRMDFKPAVMNAEDPLFILYTSG